jgi:hypothetical protein
MTLQLGALRDALIEGGTSPEKAAAAAEEVASYENRLAGIETKLVKLEGNMNLLTWMVGTLVPLNIALTAGTLWQLMSLASKVAPGQ